MFSKQQYQQPFPHVDTVGWLTEEHLACENPASATQQFFSLADLNGPGLIWGNFKQITRKAKPKKVCINTYSNYGSLSFSWLRSTAEFPSVL